VRQIRNVVLIVLATLLVVLMVENAQTVTFRFLKWTYQVSQVLLVVLVLVLGFLCGFITAKMTRGSKPDTEP
jgi:uncharacterized integral membrane protein